jgi:hypothetical protein
MVDVLNWTLAHPWWFMFSTAWLSLMTWLAIPGGKE